MIRHQYDATTEIDVEEVHRRIDGAEEAVTQVETAGCRGEAKPSLLTVPRF